MNLQVNFRFAPGEPLPPGFVATVHPEGHLEPQALTRVISGLGV